MKRLFCMSLVLTSLFAFSQKEMKVVSFKPSSSDISARTNMREDTNGDACALVKVQLPLPNAYFEGNIIGRATHKTNEYWVYMPQNTNNLIVKLAGYPPLSVDFNHYDIPILESKTTYELCILPKEPNAPQMYDEGITALAKNDVITAYDKLEKAANAGFAYANYVLGNALLEPYGLTKEEQWTDNGWEKIPTADAETYQAAYDYYRKASDANIPEALYALSNFLTKYNETKSIFEKNGNNSLNISDIYKTKVSPEYSTTDYISSLLGKAADMGNADAQWAMCSDKKWCETNAKNGIAIAEFAMGIRCDTTFYGDWDDYPKATDILPNAEEQRNINFKEAFKWYEKAAEKGLDAAQWKLGYMYALGLGVDKNIEKSIYWRKKAAEQGYIVYQLEMALSYNYGVISDLSTYESWGTSENGMPAWDAKIPNNADEADYWLRKVSNRDFITSKERRIIDGNSMYSDGMYMLGEKFEKLENYDKAIYWFQRTGEKSGDDYYKKYALAELGRIFYNGLAGKKDYKRAKYYLEKGVEANGNEAACYLGILYRDGLGVEKDLDTAKEYFMKSVDRGYGYTGSYYEMALLYYNDNKYEEARKYYRETISNCYDTKLDDNSMLYDEYKTMAYYRLGLMLYDGIGGDKDINKALDYFCKASYRGHHEAKEKLVQLGYSENLGEMVHYYELGSDRYDHKDYSEAVKWFRKAADLGHTFSQYFLGFCYHYGKGVSKDLTEAIKYYKHTANLGLAEGQAMLGYCYLNGEGVPVDYDSAVRLLKLAANKGNASAQSHLGYCYVYGKGVPKNMSEAVRWYKLAANQNYSHAIKQLKKLNEMGYK